ncbi:MAG: double-strand break repair helicase AddA [Proteobacteria bacterium]|nr:double-strand break repair helicase AddA [Pseudomonadota bacterium]MDA1356074.1 double-strand break repair helicase AddA [Pseudomonadota bacterium]
MTEAQQSAADPAASVWVSASAGTGKTKVLTDRVLRLLLGGTEPGRILCLTFTRAAAAEMAIRITGTLGEWTAAGDEILDMALREMLDRAPKDLEFRRARMLFAHVLDTPGGMKILTIHAFCQSLLRRFPLEAGIAPHFAVADDRTARELLNEAQNRLLRHARQGEDEELAAALAAITTQIGEDSFASLMGELTSARDRLERGPGGAADSDKMVTAIARMLGAKQDENETDLVRSACVESEFERTALVEAAAALAKGSDADAVRGGLIAAWLAGDETARRNGFESYCQIFITREGNPRKSLATKPVREAAPEAAEALANEQARLLALEEHRKAVAVLHSSAALIRFGARMLHYYRQEKSARAVLDYGDQIMETRKLLAAEDIAPWVLYKLDGGLDHILVDESQDTSPAQWSVIAALAEEFFAGDSAHEDAYGDSQQGARTIFAVGDEKQSIFSFQGADPEALADMRAEFRRRVEDARREWREVPLERSFRSTVAVLGAVDAVFAGADAAAGVVPSGERLHHDAERIGQAGLVEIWPVAVPLAGPEEAPWAPPVTRRAGDDPAGRLAAVIADKISGWLQAGQVPGGDGWLESKNRPIRAGDIMVLVRQRGSFVAALVRALKARNVDVAGVDRMKLTEQLAVMDLMALGDFLLLPSDDLTLAALLKGPFIGFDEEQLFDLAWQRGVDSLWRRLTARRAENPQFTRAHGILSGLLATADFRPPFEFYAEFLGAGGGRTQLLSRLGIEAADPIDEFLSAALAYERAHPPSLQGFLHWLRAAPTDLKRDPEQARNEVRVMTVHGAKGLQSPIVFLPDTLSLPHDRRSILWAEDNAVGSSGALPLWPGRRAREESLSTTLRERARKRDLEEYRRLLYVAMTRAEDRLYVCGWQGTRSPPDGCWNHMVRDGLAALEGTEEINLEFAKGDGWSGDGLRFSCAQTAAVEPATEMAPESHEIDALKSYFREPAPPEPSPPRPLAPSRPIDAPPPARGPLEEDGASSFLRGRLIHRLLELLPELEPEARTDSALRFLARPSHGLTDQAQADIAAEVLSVLSDARAQALFGPDSQAEVPLVAVLGKHVISGQVDRLVVDGDRVLVVDYKSGRAAPPDESAIATAYLVQMANYRAVLRAIFVGREIRCALLFTDGPALVWLPDAVLDTHAP